MPKVKEHAPKKGRPKTEALPDPLKGKFAIAFGEHSEGAILIEDCMVLNFELEGTEEIPLRIFNSEEYAADYLDDLRRKAKPEERAAFEFSQVVPASHFMGLRYEIDEEGKIHVSAVPKHQAKSWKETYTEKLMEHRTHLKSLQEVLAEHQKKAKEIEKEWLASIRAQEKVISDFERQMKNMR